MRSTGVAAGDGRDESEGEGDGEGEGEADADGAGDVDAISPCLSAHAAIIARRAVPKCNVPEAIVRIGVVTP